MLRLLLVCLGGALGSGARYGVGLLAARLAGTAFPYGTIAVNVIGSLLIGIASESARRSRLSATGVLFVVTGVLGGFTTYSAFNLETMRLFQTNGAISAIANVAITLVSCMVAGLAGVWVGAQL